MDIENASGYCHFNDNENANIFRINVFGYELYLKQDPGARNLGHGAVVWDAAVVLAKYMEHDPRKFSIEQLRDKKVIELGSGCGLGGICFMMRGAAVTLTDLPAVVETMTIPNTNDIYGKLATGSFGAIPSALIRPVVLPLDWTEEWLPPPGCPSPPYDLVLLTDCVFSTTLVPALVANISKCCGPRGEVLCVHEIRDEDANAAFLEELGRSFVWKRVSRTKLHPDYRNDLIEVILAKPISLRKKEKS
eukprot:gene4893-9760_t